MDACMWIWSNQNKFTKITLVAKSQNITNKVSFTNRPRSERKTTSITTSHCHMIRKSICRWKYCNNYSNACPDSKISWRQRSLKKPVNLEKSTPFSYWNWHHVNIVKRGPYDSSRSSQNSNKSLLSPLQNICERNAESLTQNIPKKKKLNRPSASHPNKLNISEGSVCLFFAVYTSTYSGILMVGATSNLLVSNVPVSHSGSEVLGSDSGLSVSPHSSHCTGERAHY